MSPSLQEEDDDLDLEELEKLIQAVEGNDIEEQALTKKKDDNVDDADNDEPSFETMELQKLLESAAELDRKESENKINSQKLNDGTFGATNNNQNDIDSSDDEEVKNFLERKYNEYGEDINKKLKQKEIEDKDKKITNEINNLNHGFSSSLMNSLKEDSDKNRIRLSSSFKMPSKLNENLPTDTKLKSTTLNTNSGNIYTDPIFGMRIINPLISSSTLIERMNGKKAVGMCSLAFHIQRSDLSQDWVMAGVIVNKSPVKTSKNGSTFSIWRITDLKGDIKFASVFLFRSAHKELWKTPIGTVIAILNPNNFDKSNNNQKNDVACLSINQSSKVMIIGQSKDFGTCKAKKKNGDICGAIVNLGECDFCLYHVQQEFGRMSKRSELQSATAGRGLQALRNKVLGKNEVFYGGQSFTAIPARKSTKLEAKDQKRLMTLSDYFQKSPSTSTATTITDSINKSSKINVKKEIPYNTTSSMPQSKIATSVEINTQQRLKDLERLKVLKGNDAQNELRSSSSSSSSSSSNSNSSSSEKLLKQSPISTVVSEKFRDKQFSFSLQKTPTLSKESFSVELNLTEKKAEMAKLKALDIIKKKPIEKANPNFIKYRGTTTGKKRIIDEIYEKDAKKSKLNEKEDEEEKQKELARKTRIQKIIEATSSHLDLIQFKENEQLNKYFYKMEKKEQLEEKMLNTYKIPCKAVICIKCKYTAFSAAEHCKEEKHPLKVIDAEKRFFECQECGNRTITVYKIPKLSCKNCQSSKWKRASMIREKKINNPSKNLSIRGDEEKFLGSLQSSASLNLLVPEE